MAVDSYTPNYNLPMFEGGTGGWGSGNNGIVEWLDAELKKRENLVLSGDAFLKSGDDMIYHSL